MSSARRVVPIRLLIDSRPGALHIHRSPPSGCEPARFSRGMVIFHREIQRANPLRGVPSVGPKALISWHYQISLTVCGVWVYLSGETHRVTEGIGPQSPNVATYRSSVGIGD